MCKWISYNEEEIIKLTTILGLEIELQKNQSDTTFEDQIYEIIS